ncbi:type II secretion system ATPase GspE [Acidisoma cellulosilytica]|uniref:Type II secretion system protein E n=1 Tax=Acidisoma cellulosilyticum TaxID=2802395 RepID=A0A964E499_9PROT|nr:type II secretion system ATPase GspE [Acidisoma cellulosilyticum]MCB8881475.1 type II secretion system ATPase GspE [Acidisoma cellulosilyticum]
MDSGRNAIEAVLAARGLLSEAALERVRRLETESGERIDLIASKLGLLSDRDLASAYAEVLGKPLVMPGDFPAEPIAPERARLAFLKRARVLPIAETDTELVLAMADPLDDAAAQALEFAFGKSVARVAAVPGDIDAAQDRLYSEGRSSLGQIADAAGGREDADRDSDLERLKDLASEAPVIRLVNALITSAVEMHASDIHLESMESGLRIRYRIDGVLREMEAPPGRLRSAVISRIKIMAKLNIAERRLAQDGRIRLAVRGKEIDFRVSTTPAIHGESVVLRILDRGSLALDFEILGFDDAQLPAFLACLFRPHGIVLVTGPTGSGKTTTLYAALSKLNAPTSKILTAEDPVEYVLHGVNQVQVKAEIGMTFASALRSFLRQDPDIMMIGEIRDLETARIAVQAALTGHLVLSTVHTNDAASAMTRLLDMGIETYLLTSTINGVLAQRLVRRLCPACREAYTPDPPLLAELQLESDGEVKLYRPVGCPQCNGVGFSGRTMILELMVMNDALRALVLRRTEARELQARAIADGMQTMYAHGMRKALVGITTYEEVLRVTREF